MPATPFEKPEDRYLTVLSLDVEQFGRFTDAQGTEVASAFRDVIEQAFQHAGLSDTYAAHAFMQNSGDGIVAGFDASRLPQIVDRIPSSLQFGLRELHQQNGHGVRMRMGISYGPVQGIDDRRIDVAPNRTVIDACRIADAEPTRLLLRNSDKEATFLAVALTEPVVDFTVARNPLWLRKSEFVKVEVSIESKDFHTTAFLHVPTPSGALLRSGLLGSGDNDEQLHGPPLEERVERSACAAYSLKGEVRADQGQANQIGRVDGDVHGERIAIGGVSGEGAIGAVTGGSVTQDHRGQDRSAHHTYIAGDQISANRDAHVTKVGSDEAKPGNGKHRLFWERTERGERP
ncbi:hypothetical protein [Glycomyces rhizosphaerae]|uniref:Guanylate cyclase domain-containing protein n=1 Tax=Glycomyces rhizosphaerae TaxID=2054422 RepID=A0ABV7PV77_9ACTN